jgi:cytochrome c oxidase assembly protein subunit 15
MKSSPVWISRFAKLCVLATIALLFIGGMVTSKRAGMAVPDWPLSYGSVNPSGWWEIENVRLEHGHRLTASFIGLLVIVLCFWTCRVETRSWVKWLSVSALVLVCLQGLIGGLRVTEVSSALAVVHGCLAQIFLGTLVVLATALSPRWSGERMGAHPRIPKKVAIAAAVFATVVFVQLIIGATMRHYNAGLAIPTFPLAFGKIIPPLPNFPVAINFAHRVGAVIVALGALHLLAMALIRVKSVKGLVAPAAFIVVLVVVQIGLGAEVILRAKPPVQTTLHVVNGALILATTIAMATRALLLRQSVRTAGIGNGAFENASGEVPA